MMLSSLPSSPSVGSFVACNIYITAASSHSLTLQSILKRAQDLCRDLRRSTSHHRDDYGNNNAQSSIRMASVAMVHAYADIPYDRSSFHLAGRSDCVANVASSLIVNALREIDVDLDSSSTANTEVKRHPFVGLVDHVSIMPLSSLQGTSQQLSSLTEHDTVRDTSTSCSTTPSPAAKAAREIGNTLTTSNLVNVHYYGLACPNNTPLAKVRRESTGFFSSGGAIDYNNHNAKDGELTSASAKKGATTVGTPASFVENFNIRLTPNISFDRARTLTQFLRGRNIIAKGYGVEGVEALTLPYHVEGKETMYEVACNLTNPSVGSVDKVKAAIGDWIEMQKQQLMEERDKDTADERYGYEYFIDEAYPVGTTETQCIDVLAMKSGDEEAFRDLYDEEVYHNFQRYLK